MKIKTNLSPSQLKRISKGLEKASEEATKPYTPENNAESEILRRSDNIFSSMLDSLQEDVTSILLGKE